jgi:3-oxoacyl-[acyl-carrier protein] reductase
MFDLSDKVALVTGATGGIGEAIARKLSQAGASLVLSGRREEKLKQLCQELPKSNYVVFDAAETDKTEAFFEEVVAKFGSLDILVCNSGITKDGLSMRMTLDDFREVMEVNCTANFLLNKMAGKYMMKKKWGRVINISSIVGVTGNAGQVNYSASKAALIGMTKSFAQEYASRAVTFNAVAPGFIATDMTSGLDDSIKEKILAEIPMKRMGSAEEIASGVLFLASKEASYITGQTLHINGGMLMV